MYMFQDAHQDSEQILEGYMQVQALAENESLRRRDLPEYKTLLESYGIK